MYTGTLIADLITVAERVGRNVEKEIAEELHAIYAMQIPVRDGQAEFMGAA